MADDGDEKAGGATTAAAAAAPSSSADDAAVDRRRRRRRGQADPPQPRRQGQPQQAEEQPPLLDGPAKLLLTFLFLQLLAKFASKHVFPQDPRSDAPPVRSEDDGDDGAGGRMKPRGVSTVASGGGRRRGARGLPPRCVWDKGTTMTLSVHVSESSDVDWDPSSSSSYPSLASWIASDLIYDTSGLDDVLRRNSTLIVPVTEGPKNNVTGLYAHVELRRTERSENGGDDDRRVLRKVMGLTRHRIRKRTRDEKNLLGRNDDSDNGSPASSSSSSSSPPPAPEVRDASPLTVASLDTSRDQNLMYAKPTLHLQIVDVASSPPFPDRRSIPPQIGDHMDWVADDDAFAGKTGGGGGGAEASEFGSASSEERELYYPILYRSEFWTTRDNLKEVNGTVDEIEVEVSLEPVSMWKWQLMSGMEQSWKRQEEFTGEEDSASDMIRTMLLETNPYLLAVTFVVSLLHSLFDFLAFKNDISFFRKSKSMEGLSVRTMIVNVFFQTVIFLYLADNDTSYMVLVSNGIGLAIEVWKASKAVKVSFEDGALTWKETKTYSESKTKEYDEIATGHLLYVTTPLVSGYGMYSLRYQTHKGWYSWILNTLVGFIYMFGFVMMTPQLFINYKLQSVAHLNWRTLTYKSLNTFVDDLFAFVIKMPVMHRLACLRDDAIFFVYLYQRYKYRTDYERVNEFGQCDKPTEAMLRDREEEERKERKEEETIEEPRRIATGESTVRRRGAREKRVRTVTT